MVIMVKILLFTTSTCHKCPEAKDYLKKHNIEYQLITADKDAEGMSLAQKYEITAVPRIVVIKTNDVFNVLTLQEFKIIDTIQNDIKKNYNNLITAVGKL